MNTTLDEREPQTEPTDELAVFRKQDAIVADLREKYMGLTIAGLDDKKGYEAVFAARQIVKSARVTVEKTRKKLKEESLERGRKIDAEAKRVTALLEPIESHLQAEEDAITAEKERIKQAEEADRLRVETERRELVKQRFVCLRDVAYSGPEMMAVPEMGEDEFAVLLATAKAENEERTRLAAEERQRQAAESARLKTLEEEQAAARAKQEAEAAEQRRKDQAELDAERERLAGIKRQQEAEAAKLLEKQLAIRAAEEAHQRSIDLEEARKQAAERSRVETEQRLAREAAEKQAAAERQAAADKAKADADEAARIKAEAEKPQRERLLAVAMEVDEINVPEGPGATAVDAELERCAFQIRKIANGELN